MHSGFAGAVHIEDRVGPVGKNIGDMNNIGMLVRAALQCAGQGFIEQIRRQHMDLEKLCELRAGQC